jgi:hypothetical protein
MISRPPADGLIVEPLRRAAHLWYSCAEGDCGLRDELDRHLKLLQRVGYAAVWHDGLITAGTDRDIEAGRHLDEADVILLLVSANYLADPCYDRDVSRAMARHESQDARVVPVIVRACDWLVAPFKHLAPLPRNRTAVTSWTNRDEAWADVAVGVREAIAELLEGTT